MAFHNLCSTATVPKGTASLLGLGLQYCIETPRPFQDLASSNMRFARSVRLLDFHNQKTSAGEEEVEFIPKLYIPSGWTPPRSKNGRLDHFCSEFTNNIDLLYRALPRHRRFNLSRADRHTMSELQLRDDLLVIPTDKNLGPSVVQRNDYVKEVLQDHLLDDLNYSFIPKEDSQAAIQRQLDLFLTCYNDHRDNISDEAVLQYFDRALSELDKLQIGKFYGMPKIHKKRKEGHLLPPLRPVCSLVGTINAIFSTYVDYILKPIMQNNLRSYIKDSDSLRESLLRTFPDGLLPGDRLFSFDAVSMYSNIDSAHGLSTIRFWLEQMSIDTSDIPVEFVMDTLNLIMNENIFQFGDTYWKQTRGAAMGTPAAVVYANLYAGLPEERNLLPNFRRNLPFYKRFIDDTIGIWRHNPADPTAWNRFQDEMNSWGSLRWETDGGLTNKLDFLDLSIKIDPTTRRLRFQTFQKKMNLYLYIPPKSSHPPGVLRGLVMGRCRKYWSDNPNKEDFKRFTLLLADRLAKRGHSHKTLGPLFGEAIARLERTDPSRPATTTPIAKPLVKDQIFYHLPFHARGINRQQVRKAFDTTIGPLINEDRRLTVAVSRPRNLRDRLCNSRLKDVEGCNPSNFLNNLTPAGTD
jgi:hypothetical protein